MTSALGFNYPSLVYLVPFVGFGLIESRMKHLTCQLTALISKGLCQPERLNNTTLLCRISPQACPQNKRKILLLLAEMVDRLESQKEAIKVSGAFLMVFALVKPMLSPSFFSRCMRTANFLLGLSLIQISTYETSRLQSTRQALNDFRKGRPTEIEIYN